MSAYEQEPLLVDTFSDDSPPGRVGDAPGGVRRHITDVERVISIDNQALRIAPLLRPGWGRAGVAYGPFRRQNGLAFAVLMLNGHNTAQAGKLMTHFLRRGFEWLAGPSPSWRALPRRTLAWLRYGDKRATWRRLRWWWHLHRAELPDMRDNLALGWFAEANPADPHQRGAGFVMHAADHENGELQAQVSGRRLPLIHSVQNIPLAYVVVLRQRGAAFYVSSLPGARGSGEWPLFRPLAIDAASDDETLYAGVHQSVLGEIGFRLDTRIHEARVQHLPELVTWYGTAHAADLLTGSGPLNGDSPHSADSPAAIWFTGDAASTRTSHGLRLDGELFALLEPGYESGLVHMLLRAGTDASGSAGIVWRARSESDHWRLIFDRAGALLLRIEQDTVHTVAIDDSARLLPGHTHAVQVLDDGRVLRCSLDGRLLFGGGVVDTYLAAETGVGLCAAGAADLTCRDFEAHPRQVRLPLDFQQVPWLKVGKRIGVADDFDGPASDLAGRVPRMGDVPWQRSLGTGVFALDGAGRVNVRATPEKPNPGRTLYTVAWKHPDFVDMQVTIHPPGDARGQGQRGRAGLVLWQDAGHYLVLNTWLDDGFAGASISTFFNLTGFEDLYDAIWSNVGGRVTWGRPYTLRLVSDGWRYLVFLDGEPVLYRALRDVYPRVDRLRINRVGLAANWEWGDDTGSSFEQFIARSEW